MHTRLCVSVVFCRLYTLLWNGFDGLLISTIQKFAEHVLGRGRAATSKRAMLSKWGKCRVRAPQIAIIDWIVRDRGHARARRVGMTWLVRAVTPMSSPVGAGNLKAAVSPVPDAIYLPSVPGHSIRLVSLSFLYYIHSRGGEPLQSRP